MDIPPFLRAFRVRLCGMDVLTDNFFATVKLGESAKTPVKASADSPKCFWESRRSCGGVGTPPPTMRCCEFAGCGGHPKRPHPFPPRVGAGVLDGPEGAAHKGGRRGRTWRDRNVEMTATGGYATNFTVCKRSRSPSSVIRLAGDRRMPPSPAGGRKWRLRIRRTWRLSSVLLPGAPGSARPTKKFCVFAEKMSTATENAKKRTNVLRTWTPLFFFVPFVCDSAAWMFFLIHADFR